MELVRQQSIPDPPAAEVVRGLYEEALAITGHLQRAAIDGDLDAMAGWYGARGALLDRLAQSAPAVDWAGCTEQVRTACSALAQILVERDEAVTASLQSETTRIEGELRSLVHRQELLLYTDFA